MRTLIDTIHTCDASFEQLASKVDSPVLLERPGGSVFRYKNTSVEIAVIQKLARLITSLRACLVLLQAGLFQEMFTIMRTMDEFTEDIAFLCIAIRSGKQTELHAKYIDEFFQEEFDNPNNMLDSSQKRHRVPRKKIQAAIAAMTENQVNPSDSQASHETITKMMSGYVHGASEHILDMYGGDPPRYHLEGLRGTPRETAAHRYCWSYFYRSFLSVVEIANAFGEYDLVKQLYQFRDQFEKQWDRTEWPDADASVRALRERGT